jgi:RNA polymerase sigma-70 factor (ECF subfamily)
LGQIDHPMISEEISPSLERLRANDREEFARLVDAYSPRIYRLGLRMLGNAQDAEEVLQNTFLQAMLNISRFEGRSSLETWLYRIATNEALMLIRKQRPEVSMDDEADHYAPGEIRPRDFADWSALPEDQLLDAEGRQALEEAIQRLPDSMRLVFVLRDIEGRSIRDTAEALGLTEVNVKTRLLRARMRLREELAGYYSERVRKVHDA